MTHRWFAFLTHDNELHVVRIHYDSDVAALRRHAEVTVGEIEAHDRQAATVKALERLGGGE